MRITFQLADRYIDPEPCECFVEYDVYVDGAVCSRFQVKRWGTDLAELYDRGEPEYLSNSDLRSAFPEARRIIAERLPRRSGLGGTERGQPTARVR